MRWHLIDRITTFRKWSSVRGRKAVSFEEYSLLKPFGRKGFFPETLAVETCVELVRWFVKKSSNFNELCLLSEVEEFSFISQIGAGDVLDISASVLRNGNGMVHMQCRISTGGGEVAHGRIAVELFPLAEYDNRELTEDLWKELYVAT